MKNLFTPVRSMVVDGMPMFMASDVRQLLGLKGELEVIPVVAVSEAGKKTYQMVSLISLMDALLEKDFLQFLLDEIGGGHESDTD